MTLISFELAEGLRTAILPPGVKRFPVPQEFLRSDMPMLLAWAETAQILLKISDFSGWWVVSDSAEWGRTLFGPSIGADVEAQQVIFTAGNFSCPLKDLQGWSFQGDDTNGLIVEWNCGESYPCVPLVVQDKSLTLRQVRAAHQSGTLWQLLKEPFSRYDPVSSLGLGDYTVTDYKTYKGFEGREEYAIRIGDRWFRANTAISRYLYMRPEVTVEKPATLTILGHGETRQGHAVARVDLRLWRKDPKYRNFDFSQPSATFIDVVAEAAPEVLKSAEPAIEMVAETMQARGRKEKKD